MRTPQRAHLDLIATDVGRLHLRLPERDRWLTERLAENVITLDCILCPCAHEIVRMGYEVEEAVAWVDRRDAELRRLLHRERR